MATTSAPTERKVNPVDHTKVKKDDLMAFVYFTKVNSVGRSGELLDVSDLDNDGTSFQVNGAPLVKRAYSADQYETEEKVSKTRAAEILISSPNRPLSVCFTKADGSERVMRGRLVAPEPLLGRSMVEDLDVKDKNRLRQVDHRSLSWLIVEGVKYIVK